MLDILDKQLIIAIQDGLPLTSRPYNVIAKQINLTEEAVIKRIRNLQKNGIIKRLGVVVKHRALGFKSNAMVVWNIPDARIKEIAPRLAGFDCISLCYLRPRHLPDWSYNLFTMIHGKDRDSVLKRIDDMIEILELQNIEYKALFSIKQFKQRGGYYLKIASDNIAPHSNKEKSYRQKGCESTFQTDKKNSSLRYENNSSLLKPLYG